MSEKKQETQPVEETHFLSRLTDWKLSDLVIVKEPKPKPEE